MAIAPPMKERIKLFIKALDVDGNPLYDRNGRELTMETETRARVKYSGEHIFTSSGNETVAALELRIPADVMISEGDGVHWLDPFSRLVVGKIAKIEDVKNFPGVVQYRKAWTTE